ncbi:hypothetical protein T440DRAFT_468797 [Plenodomus tracheiphilus IPT5]|uniref:Uncharacterized protein n=1 Tax=Plenodomus tracheiphilus IPT5 TaxID=1408161 RepID=A0A6A7B4F7_9PLEO|nr:hypothetical protein T440DRAFT_468797 [Plenodomus tracheiphilus IPT5]
MKKKTPKINFSHIQVLDFPSYPKWHTTFINSILPKSPDLTPYDLQPGDILNVTVTGDPLVATVILNTPTELRWSGVLLGGTIKGQHYFRFEELEGGQGCRFCHGEEFTGIMSWVLGEGLVGVGRKKVFGLFDSYTKDVKKRVEALEDARLGKSSG